MRGILPISVLASLALAACAPAAPPSPTAAPPKPAATTAPAPTTAPAKPAATTAPAKPAATTAPAAKPTELPAAKPAEFDEKAVADFFKSKTVRIIVGYAPGGATDTNARMLQKVLAKYIPGNPTLAIENKPGGGSMLAVNTVYNSEPKDGTAWAAFDAQLVLQQAIGAPGVQFDAGKLQWLASSYETASMCAVRLDAGINTVQELIQSGREVTVSSFGKGGVSYNPPAVFNAALGTKFKIVTGYEGGAAQRLAVKNKEVEGFCTTFETITGIERGMFEGPTAVAKVILVGGSKPIEHRFAQGVPAAETLARTDEARAMLRAVEAPGFFNQPMVVPPEVPRDRVQALRRAFDKAYKDPEYIDAAQKAQQAVSPHTGEEVTRIVQEVLGTPPAVLAKLKEILE
ncbi:MAG: hypothetical protein HY690_01920 [Chloroflexi bacterium]|nr:hypothetical protein [Chloroflexota bacterium]